MFNKINRTNWYRAISKKRKLEKETERFEELFQKRQVELVAKWFYENGQDTILESILLINDKLIKALKENDSEGIEMARELLNISIKNMLNKNK